MEFSEESLREGAKIMKKIINGEPKNINPLKKMPKPEMRLYCINNNYFDTKKELEEYCKNNKISIKDMYTLDYIRNVAGRNDVICKTKANSKPILYKAVDEDGYGIYNYDRSVYRGEFIQEYSHGDIRSLYKPFRDRGIVFENDVYAKIDELYQKIFELRKGNKGK